MMVKMMVKMTVKMTVKMILKMIPKMIPKTLSQHSPSCQRVRIVPPNLTFVVITTYNQRYFYKIYLQKSHVNIYHTVLFYHCIQLQAHL